MGEVKKTQTKKDTWSKIIIDVNITQEFAAEIKIETKIAEKSSS